MENYADFHYNACEPIYAEDPCEECGGTGEKQEVRATLDGLGELPAEMWGDYGVPWSDMADAKSGTRTTIYRDDGRKLVIEPRQETA